MRAGTSRGVNRSDVTLNVYDVARAYGRHRVLCGVTFSAHRGELVGIVGENGAGKSTLLRILAGLLRADRGRVEISGRIGYCPQEPQLHFGLTVEQNLEWFHAAYRLPNLGRANALMDQLALGRHRRALVNELSGGSQQKLNLVLALAHDPEILLLDEPYQGFDWETYLRFWDIADESRRAGRVIVIISHLVFEQKRFDAVLRLQEGVLAPVGGR